MAQEVREVMGEKVENSDPVGLVGHCENLELSRGGTYYDRFRKDHSAVLIDSGSREAT